MWRVRLVALVVVGSLVVALLVLGWRENERRYAAFMMTGCFGESGSAPLGPAQDCNGARRLCRDAAPLIDWRHFCD